MNDEYRKAADYLKSYVASSDFIFQITTDDIKNELDYFQKTYAPEALEKLDDTSLLTSMFYSVGDNTNALCCYLEMNKNNRQYFGGIAGGSSYKFGLFQKKETGKWTTGSPQKPMELSEDEALVLGKEIRDALVKGSQAIRDAELKDISSYEKLDAELKMILGSKMYNWSWIHKYFSLICNDKLSGFHSNEWQYHVLRVLHIKPSRNYYTRSGQISIIQNYAGWYYRELIEVLRARFGKPRQFVSINAVVEGKNCIGEWKQRDVVGIGWSKIGDLSKYIDKNGISKEKVQNKLTEIYFKDDEKNASKTALEIVRFYKCVEGTVFVIMNGDNLLALAEGKGDYHYDSSCEAAHLQHASWKHKFDKNDKLPNKEEKLSDCSPFSNDDNMLFLYDKFFYESDNYICLNPKEGKESDGDMKNRFDHNIILYGPPGTGKTYNSVIYAVAICDDRAIEDVRKEEYSTVLTRYNELRSAGRIVFTTFHQSYGYEEFIEGIRPVMADEEAEDSLKYIICDGVFKKLCNEARMPETAEIDHNASIWLVWLKDRGSNDLKTDCFRNGEIRFDGPENPGKEFKWEYDHLIKMKQGDFVITYYGKSRIIDGVGIIQDDDLVYDNNKSSFKWTRKVKWLITDKQIDVRAINSNKYLSNFSLAFMSHMKLSDLLCVVEENGGMTIESNKKQYVIIIDEINRGNISKIFGELITLIEDRKRAGAKEAMEAILPYSGESFSVPDNVYIIGTMNTADRSIALMDTALRRRFDFKEIMPTSTVLKEFSADKVESNGEELDVSRMLDIINQRIEYLYDREHTIGHAFFISLAEDPSIEMLASIFEKKVIPLLQEYFYEDYDKIQLVLGDNDKPDEYKFILDRKVKSKDIFNGDPDVDLPEIGYSIQREAFLKIKSYKLIGKNL